MTRNHKNQTWSEDGDCLFAVTFTSGNTKKPSARLKASTWQMVEDEQTLRVQRSPEHKSPVTIQYVARQSHNQLVWSAR